MPRYDEKYTVGSQVRVASREKLDDFYAHWKYHNKLTPEQLAYADRIVDVVRVGFYHGGDVLYELQGVPGIWHEDCLEDVTSQQQ